MAESPPPPPPTPPLINRQAHCNILACCRTIERVDEIVVPSNQALIKADRERSSPDTGLTRLCEVEVCGQEESGSEVYAASFGSRSPPLVPSVASGNELSICEGSVKATSNEPRLRADDVPICSHSGKTARDDEPSVPSAAKSVISSPLSPSSEIVDAVPSLEPTLSINNKMSPWEESSAPPEVCMTSQMTLADVVEIQQGIFQIASLQNEAKHCHIEEQLFRAWVAAESCIRQSSRLIDRIEATWPSVEGQKYTEEVKSISKSLTASDYYFAISTKVRLLFDTFSLYGLDDRFEVSSLGFDEIHMGGERTRMLSRDSMTFDTLPISLDKASGTTVEPPTRHGKRFFRLGSRSSRKTRKKNRNRQLPSIPPADTNSASKKSNRFSIRRGKGGRTETGNLSSASASPSALAASSLHPMPHWNDENAKGLELSHKINSNGSISIRIRVKLRVPLFQVLAILNEVDYYDKWIPYCKKCVKLDQLSLASMIIQQLAEYPWPLKQKETISYCFGIDALDEFGCVLINSCGLGEEVTSFLGTAIPPPVKKIPRVQSSNFLFLLFPVVDESAATVVELFSNIDTGVTALKSVVLPILRIIVVKSVKGFFHKIGYLATHFASSEYQKKTEENPDTYDWIKRRIQEGIEKDRFRPGTSVQTLVFDDIK